MPCSFGNVPGTELLGKQPSRLARRDVSDILGTRVRRVRRVLSPSKNQSLHGPAATYFQACLVFVNTAQIEATFVKIPKTGDRDLFTRTIVDPYA